MLSARTLRAILSDAADQADAEAKITHHNSGPGQLNRWTAIMDGQTNSWINREATATRLQKPAIIFSNYLLSQKMISRVDIQFLASLIAEYDVYLWPGENVKLTDCKPISNLNEFWQKYHAVVPATQHKIERCLALQGIRTEDYICCDNQKYRECIDKVFQYGVAVPSTQPSPPSTLDLTLYTIDILNLNILLDSFDPEKITKIKVESPSLKLIQFLLKHLRHVKAWHVTNVSQEWLSAHLSDCRVENIVLEQSFGTLQTLSIPRTSCKTIKFENCRFLTELHVSKDSETEVLKFDRCPKLTQVTMGNSVRQLEYGDIDESGYSETLAALQQIAFPSTVKIEKLIESGEKAKIFPLKKEIKKVTDIDELKKMSKAELLAITGLDIRDKNITDLDFVKNHCKNMQKLTLRECDKLKAFHAREFPFLQQLMIFVSANHDMDIDLHGCAQLKILEVAGSKKLTAQQLPPSVQIMILRRCDGIANLYFEELPLLEDCIVESCQHLSELTASPNANLKAIGIVNCPHLTDICSSAFPQLMELNYFNNNPIGGDTKKLNMDLHALQKLQTVQIDMTQEESVSLFLTLDDSVELREMILSGSSGEAYISLKNCKKLDYTMMLLPHIQLNHFADCQRLAACLVGGDTLAVDVFPLQKSFAVQQFLSSRIEARVKEDRQKAEQKITQEQITLNALNFISPVSYFSLDDMATVDTDTGAAANAKPRIAQGQFKVTLDSKNNKKGNIQFRVNVRDTILFDGYDMVFSKASLKSQLQPFQQHIAEFDTMRLADWRYNMQNDSSLTLGLLEGVFVPGEFYPLPMAAAFSGNSKDISFCAEPLDAVEVYWHPEHQLYYAQVNKAAQNKPVKILYQFKHNEDYEKTPRTPFVTNKNLLPIELKKRLESDLNNFKPLQFLFDKSMTIENKMALLIEYCKFENAELSAENKMKSGADALFALIKERKGACRHRSQAFMLLARYLGIPARMIYNEKHAFSEIPSETEKNLNWHRLDHGGAPVMDLTPANKRDNIFDSLLEEKSYIDRTKISDAWSKRYQRRLKKLISNIPLHFVNQLLEKLPLSPVIKLNSHQEIRKVKRELIKQLRQRKKSDIYANYLYINHPSDLKKYLRPYYLKDGKRTQLAGPLAKICSHGGTLIVNWSNFNSTEIASFKSMIDKVPTLFGDRISEKVKIIGLTTPDLAACSAFFSRCQTFLLQEDFFTPEPTALLANKSTRIIDIDLLHRPDWQEPTLGKIEFLDDQIHLQTQSWLNAVAAEKSEESTALQIYNAPNDPAFVAFKEQLEDERRLFFNGEMIDLPADFSVLPVEQRDNPTHLANVSVEFEEKLPSSIQRIPLNLQNLHECFQNTHYVNKKAVTAETLLDKYQPSEHVFYITSNISKSDWQILLKYIAEKHPHKQFKFLLAPGAEIEFIIKNEGGYSHARDKETVVLSNDPDYLTQELTKNIPSALIVDVTPDMSLQDLIAKISIQQQESNANKVDFIYDEKDMLKMLVLNKPVILNGEVSPTLYQQLLPLLLKEKQAKFNETLLKLVPGQLTLIMPEKAKETLSLIAYTQHNYALRDYKNAFLAKDQPLIDKLILYHDIVKRIPHRGASFPEEPVISYAHLSRMLAALNNTNRHKLHPHNPIKGLFNYDYPRYSEDYAFLNVVGKYLFGANDKSMRREDKLKELIYSNKIKNEDDLMRYSWHVLNCFNGAELAKLFNDKPLTECIVGKNQLPIPTAQIISKLWKEIQPHVNAPTMPAESKSSHVAKREAQLMHLIQSANTPIIMIKGDPGVGKTFTVNQIKKKIDIAYHEGYQGIEAWLNDKSDKPVVLLLDEANMAKPGTWDFLKGLSRDNKIIYYQGKIYQVTDRHKIIATGNPENYQSRSYHLMFQHYAETLHFRMPEDDYLLEHVLKPILGNQASVAKSLLAAYHLVQEKNPIFGYSMRDLENLAQRFLIVSKKNDLHLNEAKLLLKTCRTEFAGNFSTEENRADFIKALSDLFKVEPPPKPDPTALIEINSHYYPQDKVYLINGIIQDLQMRHQAMQNPAGYYKLGTLIEGEAGLGKSTLYQLLLEQQKFHHQGSLYHRQKVPENEMERITLFTENKNSYILTANELMYVDHQGLPVILDKSLFAKAHQMMDKKGGIGSTLKPAILTTAELSALNNELPLSLPSIINTTQRYYEISVGDQNAHAVLLKAFHEGSVVILDELNLDSTLEELMNQLLTGKNPDGKPPAIPGFFACTSQNPSYEKGRQSVSEALRNRMHVMHMNPYSDASLVAIAEQFNIPSPHSFVQEFLNAKKDNPDVNMRTFYTFLRSELQAQSLASEALPSQEHARTIAQENLAHYGAGEALIKQIPNKSIRQAVFSQWSQSIPESRGHGGAFFTAGRQVISYQQLEALCKFINDILAPAPVSQTKGFFSLTRKTLKAPANPQLQEALINIIAQYSKDKNATLTVEAISPLIKPFQDLAKARHEMKK